MTAIVEPLASEVTTKATNARAARLPLLVAAILGCVQLAILIFEEISIASRGELTMDYQAFARAYWFIGHGHLTPIIDLPISNKDVPYIQNHFELLTWPLALFFVGLLRLPVHVVLLDVLQALPTAALTPLVALWGADIAKRRSLTGLSRWTVVLVPTLLSFVDIWQYKADSFDFHYQALQGALLVGALIAFQRNATRTGWIVLLVLAMTGDTAGLVIEVVALVLIVRHRWRSGLGALVLGVLVLVVPALLHDNLSNGVALHHLAQVEGQAQGSLWSIALGLVSHPLSVLRELRSVQLDIWAVFGGAGLLGCFSDIGLAAILCIGLPAWLSGLQFAYPGNFQTEPLSAALLLGAASVLGWMCTRRFWGTVMGVCGLIVAGGWSAVFAPPLIAGIRSVSNSEVGASLSLIARQIPADAEVVSPNASLGTVGLSGARVLAGGCVPWLLVLPRRPVAFVVDPWRGIQTCDPAQLLVALSAFANLPGAKVLGPLPGRVYWVEWTPRGRDRMLHVSGSAPISARFLAGEPFAAGRLEATAKGPALVSDSKGGFVVEGIVAGVAPHHVGEATLHLSVSGSAQVQIWDDQSGQLVARRIMAGNGALQTETVTFRAPRFVNPTNFTDGKGIFVTRLLPPIPEDPMEVRVWIQPGSRSVVHLYDIGIDQVATGGSHR
jgi:hypothetical protein